MEPLEQIKARVLEIGKAYEPALLPPTLQRMSMGFCFDNCALLAAKSHALEGPKYTYVEGVVIPSRGSHKGLRMLHAWLTDGYHAFDPTWHAYGEHGEEIPFPGEYIGIEMDIKKVAKFMRKSEYQGLLPNGWRKPYMFKRIVPSFGEPIELPQQVYDKYHGYR